MFKHFLFQKYNVMFKYLQKYFLNIYKNYDFV